MKLTTRFLYAVGLKKKPTIADARLALYLIKTRRDSWNAFFDGAGMPRPQFPELPDEQECLRRLIHEQPIIEL